MEEQNNVQEPVKKKGGTVKLVLIVALIAALAGGAGVYFLLENKDKEEKTETKTENVVENNNVNEVAQNNVVEDTNNTTNGGGFLSGLLGNSDENNTVNNTIENTVVNNTIDTNTTTNTVVDTNTTTEPNTNTNTTSTNVKESTAENPLALGEWGNASKYVSEYLSEEYKDVDYTPVPVSVTKVTRGEEAAKILKAWCDNSSYYKYEDPKEKMEWVIVDYKVDLTGLTFDEGTIGTDRDIKSSVTGKNGGSIEYNGMRYYVSTTDITTSEYAEKPGIYDGQFAVQLPVGCTDYVIKMGNDYDNRAVSYFKGQ